jgi:hypothetical protein
MELGGLTAFEKWSFDHHGFLIVEAAVQGEALAHLQATATAWHASVPDDLSGGPSPIPQLQARFPPASPLFWLYVRHISRNVSV